jgi:hypothetical protein
MDVSGSINLSFIIADGFLRMENPHSGAEQGAQQQKKSALRGAFCGYD